MSASNSNKDNKDNKDNNKNNNASASQELHKTQMNNYRELFDVMDIEKKGYVGFTDILRGISKMKSIPSINVGKVVESLVSKPCRFTFDQLIKYNLLRYLDAVFEPHGNILVGLEPQLFRARMLEGTASEQLMSISSTDYAPIVLIPGLAGSALLEGSTRAWLNLSELVSGYYETHLALEWDSIGNKATSNFALTVEQGINSIVDLDNTDGTLSGFQSLVTGLSGASIGAAPYDWRMVPQEEQLDEWVDNIKTTISDLYNTTGKKVFICAHSVGNLMAMMFFHKEPLFAADTVAGYIASAPPFGGAALAVRACIEGYQKVISVGGGLLSQFPSMAWNFPTDQAFGGKTVVEYNNVTYKPSELQDFLDIALPSSTAPIYQHVQSTLPANYLSTPPPCPVWLATSVSPSGPTAMGVKYNTSTATWDNLLETGPIYGDGTVPYDSLHAMDTAWSIPNANKIEIPSANHGGIISAPEFITMVQSIIAI